MSRCSSSLQSAASMMAKFWLIPICSCWTDRMSAALVDLGAVEVQQPRAHGVERAEEEPVSLCTNQHPHALSHFSRRCRP